MNFIQANTRVEFQGEPSLSGSELDQLVYKKLEDKKYSGLSQEFKGDLKLVAMEYCYFKFSSHGKNCFFTISDWEE